MKTSNLMLNTPVANTDEANLKRVLAALPGVVEIRAFGGGRGITVQFDETETTQRELRQALLRTGYGIEATVDAHGVNGSCCGSCGG